MPDPLIIPPRTLRLWALPTAESPAVEAVRAELSTLPIAARAARAAELLASGTPLIEDGDSPRHLPCDAPVAGACPARGAAGGQQDLRPH